MPRAGQLWHSGIGLVRALTRELGSAIRCLLAGRASEGAEHVRFALQAAHDDLVTLVVSRGHGTPLPSANQVTRILIVKLDRIGDMVNTTPVFDVLRDRYPNVQLDVVGHPAVLTLLDGDPRVAKRFPYTCCLYHGGPVRPPGLAAWRLVRELWSARYPLVVYLRGSFPFLLLGLRSRIVASKFVEGEPVIRRYLKPLNAAGDPGDPLPIPSLHVSSASRALVLSKYPAWGGGPSVVIHAVSAAEGKQWPLERFARVADEISARGEARILFLAAPAERGIVARLQALCKRPHDFETGFGLREVVAAIAHADLFIGNDSGLAHIAAGVQTPEVVVWGAANLDMARPVTPPGNCTVLYRDVACRAGCPEIRCVGPERLKCLVDITAGEVIAAALGYLRAKLDPQLKVGIL
jgi:heptosyltransferase II